MDEARQGERAGASESIEPARRTKALLSFQSERELEAGAGIEPANRGFADPDLTTWLPRRNRERERRGRESNPLIAVLQTAAFPLGYPAL